MWYEWWESFYPADQEDDAATVLGLTRSSMFKEVRSVTFDPTTEFDPSVMAPSSTTVLWEGSSENLTHAATGGRVRVASYRLTEDGLYFASGVISNKEELLPLWGVADVDLSQGPTQKLRKVGDLKLKLDPVATRTYGQMDLTLKSISDPKTVRSLILQQANDVRRYWNNWRQQRAVEQRRAGAVQLNNVPATASTPSSPTSDAQDDLLARLTKLGDMKQAGLLSEEEFTAAKAKLIGQ